MNLREELEMHLSSPLDQQRLVLGALARLVDMLDADTGVTSTNYLASAALAELKLALDGNLTDTRVRRRMILKALFELADKVNIDTGATRQDYRARLEALYSSPLMERFDAVSEQRVLLGALEIVCEALDADTGATRLDFSKTVFNL